MFSNKHQLIRDAVAFETIGDCVVSFVGIDPRIGSLYGHSHGVSGCSIASDDRFIVSDSGDRTLKIWDVESGSLLQTLEGHQKSVSFCCISSDNRFIVSASYDRTLKIWDVESGSLLQTLECHQDSMYSCCISSDDRFIVSASDDRTLKIWDISNVRENTL